MTRHLVRPGKFNLLYRWAYTQIDKYIFVSNTAEQGFFSSCNQPIRINNCVIYNGVRGIRTSTESINLRQTFNLDDTVHIIGCAGRLVPDKGISVLIKAFEQSDFSKKSVLIFAGNNDEIYYQEIKAFLSTCESKNRIFFHPYIENIYDFIEQLDIIVVPSIVKECCPLIILEAMQQGTAIVSTNNGAQTELLTNEQEALLVPPSDPDALRKAIQQLIDFPEIREQLAKKAQQKSKQFSYDKFFQKMSEAYGI